MRIGTRILGALLTSTAVVSAQLADGLYAAINTSMGGMTCRLDYAEAPLTCANFVGLAEGTQHWIDTDGRIRGDSLYAGPIFHRVIEGFMIQGGDPAGNGTGGPGYRFPDEFSTNLTHHSAGILSMANSGENSNGSQFFITLEPTSWLDGKHSVFGEVVDGMNVVSNIGAVATGASDRPLTNVVIHSVQILRIGTDAQLFDPAAQALPEAVALPLEFEYHDTNIVVVSTVFNRSSSVVYSSEDLTNWVESTSRYDSAGGSLWNVDVLTNRPVEYFRGTRVFYPQAVTLFAELEGRHIYFSQGTNVLSFTPEAGGLGSCDIAGYPDTLTYWEEWTSDPYVGRVVFQPSNVNAFQFVLPLGGSCQGYQYSALGWQYIGDWVFGETDAVLK